MTMDYSRNFFYCSRIVQRL